MNFRLINFRINNSAYSPLFFYVGLCGALAGLLSDIVLLGLPVSGSYFDIASFGAVPMVTHARAAIGAFGGMLGALFTCFSMVYFYRAHMAFRNSQLMLLALCGMSIFAACFHSGYYFLYHAATNAIKIYLLTIALFSAICQAVASLVIYKLCKKNIGYGYRWCSPLIFSGGFFILFYFLPAPIGGFIRPTFINAALCIFLIVQKRVCLKL